jgi:uncharacterized Ntn-hydrolase superfamily protein
MKPNFMFLTVQNHALFYTANYLGIFAFKAIEKREIKLRAANSSQNHGTFSILAASSDKKLMGVAVASGSTSVGERVPHAKPGVGVIATQAYTNVLYGVKGLELLAKGFSPKEALNTLLAEDAERELRQVAIMDFQKRKAVFTGKSVPDFWAEIVGENCVAIGNLLARSEVVSKMAESFENSRSSFALRLVEALKAGSETGGDKRGERSAALIVVDARKAILNLKVDFHPKPIDELLRQLKHAKP